MIRLPSTLLKTAALAALLLLAPTAFAQNNNGGNNNGGNNNGGNNNGGNNNNTAPVAGVSIDAQGVLRVLQPNANLTARKLWAAKQSLPQHLARPSKLRKVSLNRLEEVVAQKLADGEQLDPEMLAMAGITRLEYVFFYPESGDIVIAGPAEGFAKDSVGRTVGVDSGKPCLQLDDVIVALRAFAPSSKPTSVISVSIDPTQEGLARMQKTLAQLGSNFRGPQDIPVIMTALKQSLGMNDVTIKGVSPSTHFAHVLTQADYRMKLIGIGNARPPVPQLVTYASRMTASVGSNALMRWYFVPDYEAVTTNTDFTAMKLTGQGLKLVDETEVVTADGQRKSTGRANPASKQYTVSFTKNFPRIAAVDPVYAELRNLVDLTVAAAFMQKQEFYQQAGWDLGVFASENSFPVETLPAPRQVETAINAVMKGRRLITPIGGGVAIQAKKALAAENMKEDDGSIAKQREAVSVDSLDNNQWWWD
ncbi:MAG: DUF1598 domain-containing protein [Aureliella sp.]